MNFEPHSKMRTKRLVEVQVSILKVDDHKNDQSQWEQHTGSHDEVLIFPSLPLDVLGNLSFSNIEHVVTF